MRVLTILLTTVLVMAASISIGATMYGTEIEGGVYLIDTDAQTTTYVFNGGLPFYGATDGDIVDNIFATTLTGDLYRLNPVSMVSTFVGSSGGVEIKELAKNEVSRVLYGTNYESLFIIDVVTGEATVVGPLNAAGSVWAMDYDTSINQLVAISYTDGNLYYVDMATGAATIVGPTGQERITDIWYDADSGEMFGDGHFEHQIYSINTATGAATVLFAIDVNILGLGSTGVNTVPTDKTSLDGVKALFR